MKTILLALSIVFAWQATITPAEAQSLQTQITALKAQVAALQAEVTKLQHNPALQLGAFVAVDPNPENGVAGPNITFTGANIHIVSGAGYTGDLYTGRGNLIIGYDESQIGELQPTDRSGSHNLVLGRYNKFTRNAFGSFVSGEQNTLNGWEASIFGGAGNILNGYWSVILGGVSNQVRGMWSIGGGGFNNSLSGDYAVFIGGSSAIDTGAEYNTGFGLNNGTTIGLK